MDTLNRVIENYPPELKLVLVCCGSKRWDRSTLFHETNWDEFLRWARRHRVIPVIHRYANGNPDFFPGWVKDKVSLLQQAIVRHSLLLGSELIQTGKLFDKNNIHWSIIKGPALAIRLYGDITARDYRDLDILINHNDLQAAITILESQEFHSVHKVAIKKLTRLNHNIEFIKTSNHAKIELHWQLFANKKMFGNNLSSMEPIQESNVFQDYSLQTLSATDDFIYTLLHGTIHQWQEIQWILDTHNFSRLINNGPSMATGYDAFSPAIQTFENLYHLLFSGNDKAPHKFPASNLTRQCLDAIVKKKASDISRLKKTFYLLMVNKSAAYKKEVLVLRILRTFSNPAKRNK